MKVRKHTFRFLGEPDPNAEGVWTVRGTEFQHLRKVLKLAVGDQIEVFDGQERGIGGVISEVSKGEARVEERKILEGAKKQRARGVLAVGALKHRALDTIIPPLVELDVAELHVFLHG